MRVFVRHNSRVVRKSGERPYQLSSVLKVCWPDGLPPTLGWMTCRSILVLYLSAYFSRVHPSLIPSQGQQHPF
jgi:hypothetical protein